MGSNLPTPFHKFQQFQPSTKTIKIDNIAQELSQCQQVDTIQCSIYQTLHQVSYNGHEFSMGKSIGSLAPEQHSIHYLLHPNIILLPPYRPLEEVTLSQYDTLKDLVRLMKAIGRLGASYEIGFGRNRIALSSWTKQWGTLGQNLSPFWNYQKLLKQGKQQKVYLSPELMKAYSKDKIYPKVNVKQSDVFVFAIMMLEIIFNEDLQSKVYDYQGAEIKLKPILEKMALLQDNFPQQLYLLFIGMLEFDPEERSSFEHVLRTLEKINVSQVCVSSPEQIQREIKLQDCTPPPNTNKSSSSPNKLLQQRNSDLRGRSPGVIRKNIQNDKSGERTSLSPFRYSSGIQAKKTTKFKSFLEEDSDGGSNLFKITPNRQKIWEGMERQRPSVEPFGLKLEQQQSKPEKARKPIVQRLRS